MDKSWISAPRTSTEYSNGVKSFIQYGFEKSRDSAGRILCPCNKCFNGFWFDRQGIEDHLFWNGFNPHYENWIFHGEPLPNDQSPFVEGNKETTNEVFNDGVNLFVHETLGIHEDDDFNTDDDHQDPATLNDNENARTKKYEDIMKEASTELYPGCTKYNRLTFVLHFAHLKSLCGLTNKGATMFLEFMQDLLPEGVQVPKNWYETNQIVKKLGVHYEKIHACPNHCMLFWKENSDKDNCTKCNASRWGAKENMVEGQGDSTVSKTKKHRVPAKVLRWFPLKERLQKLFLSSKTAQSMRWHKEERKDDGLLRHPADSMVWKDFDKKYPDYAKEPRNVRLGLASDGFNPFGNMSLSYSMWPVILMPYNLPPWMCMKQTSFILSLLIPGPSQPGNNIDVYLQPLVDELRELWEEGIDTFDSYSKETFKLHASLLWTINDFPAYASLSGWSTKGEFACPTCNYDSSSYWLRHSQKWCYTGHRRWLKDDHKYRKDKKLFNGVAECRAAPRLLSGSELLEQINALNFESTNKRKRGDPIEKSQWKKKAYFSRYRIGRIYW